MKPNHINGSSPKKSPMTPAERARRYRERRKLKLLGISTNLLEQALNGYSRSMLPEQLEKIRNEYWSQIEPGLSDIIDQDNLLQDGTEDHIGRCDRLKENDAVLPGFMVDDGKPIICKQEDGNLLHSKNASIDIKTEPDLTGYVSQDDVSQRDTMKDSIPECSQLKKEHSNTMRFLCSVDAEKISNAGTERQKNYQTKMCDQEQQTNEVPIAAIAERWMINWYGDKPIAEPVINQVKTGQKRPMTAAERKRKSREKQRAEAKFFRCKPENCSCGTDSKTRDKLKAEVEALTHRKELLSAQITLLQAQPQQMKLDLAENDSEGDLSNVSTNDSSTKCSRFKEVSFDSQMNIKKAILLDKGHEINNSNFTRKTFFGINGMLDDFQIFGEFVATELRNLKSDVNRRRLKRMIQKVIIEVSESEDL